MLKFQKITPVVLLAGAFYAAGAQAQEMNPTATDRFPQQQEQGPSAVRNGIPLYKIQVVARDIPAINYFHRSGSTKIGFEGTPLLARAKGSATVQSNKGGISIDLHLEGLPPANGFGVEYLTYVLWAISADGHPQALGEVLPTGGGNKVDMKVTTNLQAFALIVTAEPYFYVSAPSDVVVLQNVVLNDKTQGIIEPVVAHASLLPRGAYSTTSGSDTVLHPITRNDESPLELYEAINAIQIAKAAGADRYATDTFQSAVQNLQNAQAMDAHKSERKQEITYARAAVQSAEDSRVIAIRKHQAMDAAAQQRASEQAQQQAQQSALDAQQAKLQAEQASAERAKAELQAAQAQAQAAQAQQAQQQAAQQTQQIRQRLRDQLNSVLNTQESARGLIVNMSDVLFDTGKYTLKSDAQVKLAKVSGILQAYPSLKVQVEGYTDNVGGEQYNQKLSENRAQAVGDFLVAQGVPLANVTATGFGLTNPVADNGSAEGRAQNRRVELVVSGDAIGVQQQAEPAGGTTATPNQAQPQ
ncbi:OmpA family protein [Acidipila sp. EB88]|uniref:OmpA family protein n=1 Tax=Acidipila sp. EB88 TaxID=2305226 RepID=UPI000F5DD92C|nr:OmpA family protein [Acidipila sp. EB88]RRA48787.1 OmpA family protein [Acidipila sp. EB88]